MTEGGNQRRDPHTDWYRLPLLASISLGFLLCRVLGSFSNILLRLKCGEEDEDIRSGTNWSEFAVVASATKQDHMLAAYTSRVKRQDEFSSIARSNSESSLHDVKGLGKKLTLTEGKGSLLDGLGLEASKAVPEDDDKAKTKAKRLALIARSKARRELKAQEQKEKEDQEKKEAEKKAEANNKRAAKANAFPLNLARDANRGQTVETSKGERVETNKGRAVEKASSGGYALENLAASASLIKSSGTVSKTKKQQTVSLHSSQTMLGYHSSETDKHAKPFIKSDHVRAERRRSADLDSSRKLEESGRGRRANQEKSDVDRGVERKKSGAQKLQELRAIRKERRAEEEHNRSISDMQSDARNEERGRPRRGVERSETSGAKLEVMRGRNARSVTRANVRGRAKSTTGRAKSTTGRAKSTTGRAKSTTGRHRKTRNEPDAEMEEMELSLSDLANPMDETLDRSGNMAGRIKERREQMQNKSRRSEDGLARSTRRGVRSEHGNRSPSSSPKQAQSSNARRLTGSSKRIPERNEALGKSVGSLSIEGLETSEQGSSRSSSDRALPLPSFNKQKREKPKESTHSKSPMRKSDRNEAMGKSMVGLHTEDLEEKTLSRNSSDAMLSRATQKQKYYKSKEKWTKTGSNHSKSPMRRRERSETLGRNSSSCSDLEESDQKASTGRSSQEGNLPSVDENQSKERSKDKCSKSGSSRASKSPRRPGRNETRVKSVGSLLDLEEIDSELPSMRVSSEGGLPTLDDKGKKERSKEQSSSSNHSKSPRRRPERDEALGKSQALLASEPFEETEHKRRSSETGLSSSNDKEKRDRLREKKDESKDPAFRHRSRSAHRSKAGSSVHRKRSVDVPSENRDQASPKGSSDKDGKTSKGVKAESRQAGMQRSLSQEGILGGSSGAPASRKLHRRHSDESFLDSKIPLSGGEEEPKRSNSSSKLTKKEKSGTGSKKDDKAKSVSKRPGVNRSLTSKGILGGVSNGAKRPGVERSHSEKSFLEFAKDGKTQDKQKTKSSSAHKDETANSESNRRGLVSKQKGKKTSAPKDDIAKSENTGNRRGSIKKSMTQKCAVSEGLISDNKRDNLRRTRSQKGVSATADQQKSPSQRPSLQKMRSHSERSFRTLQAKSQSEEADQVKHGKEALRAIPRRNRSAGQELERAAKEAAKATTKATAKERKAKKNSQRA